MEKLSKAAFQVPVKPVYIEPIDKEVLKIRPPTKNILKSKVSEFVKDEFLDVITSYQQPEPMNIDEIDYNMWYFKQQATILGMSDWLSDIHTSISTSDLDTFSVDQLTIYADLMGIDLTHLTDEVLMKKFIRNEKIRWIEMRKYYMHIEDALFSGKDEKPMIPKYRLEFFQIPSVREILENGARFYFFTLGELTPEALIDRYERYELLMILMHILIVANEEDFKLQHTNDRDLASHIIYLATQTLKDVRNVVGMIKMYSIHNIERNEVNFDINDDSILREELGQALIDQGYIPDTTMTRSEMFAEYCLQVFAPSFVSILDPHRLFPFQHGDIFFGIRTGLGQYTPYFFDELIESFERNKDFIKPRTQVERFSLYSIIRLRNLILPTFLKNPSAQKLISVIDNLKVRRGNIIYKDIIGEATRALFNLAFMLENWDTYVRTNHYDAFYKAENVLLEGSEFTGDAEYALTKTLIVVMEKVKKIDGMGQNTIIKLKDDQAFRSDFSLIDFLSSILSINSHKIYGNMQIYGYNLLTTMAYYESQIRGNQVPSRIVKIEI